MVCLFGWFFRIAVEKLHEMDDAFRKQLQSMVAAHEEELLHLAEEKEKQIEAANEKVILILNVYVYCVCTATVVPGSHLFVSLDGNSPGLVLSLCTARRSLQLYRCEVLYSSQVQLHAT